MSIDSIGNFLTIIRNGIMASKPSVAAPFSKIRLEIARILKEEGFIKDFSIENADSVAKKSIKIMLKYVDGESVIHDITRVSKPSRRNYAGINSVKPVIGGLGISILSTNKGIVSNRQAKKLLVGGEIICTVW